MPDLHCGPQRILQFAVHPLLPRFLCMWLCLHFWYQSILSSSNYVDFHLPRENYTAVLKANPTWCSHEQMDVLRIAMECQAIMVLWCHKFQFFSSDHQSGYKQVYWHICNFRILTQPKILEWALIRLFYIAAQIPSCQNRVRKSLRSVPVHHDLCNNAELPASDFKCRFYFCMAMLSRHPTEAVAVKWAE